MRKLWIHAFAAQVGRYLRDCPPPPNPKFSERLVRLLWALERIEQRRWRREASAHVRNGHRALH